MGIVIIGQYYCEIRHQDVSYQSNKVTKVGGQTAFFFWYNMSPSMSFISKVLIQFSVLVCSFFSIGLPHNYLETYRRQEISTRPTFTILPNGL